MRRRSSPALLAWLLLPVLSLTGCAHLCNPWCADATAETPPPVATREPRPRPKPPPPPDPQPEVLPQPVEPPSPFAAADSLFERGELAAARDSYLAYLNEYPGRPDSAHALLRLAVIYLQPDGPAYDPALAARVLDRLIAEHPQRPERRAARALRTLYGEANELQRQLDELKRIDLQAGDEAPE